MQISTNSVYFTEGAIFEKTDLTHALSHFVPIKSHKSHEKVYTEVFHIDHFMKNNLKHISEQTGNSLEKMKNAVKAGLKLCRRRIFWAPN